MNLKNEFNDLQRSFAEKDLLTESRPRSSSSMELLLIKRKDMKIKIYQEKGHILPHIHIDYGNKKHAASYAIESGERLEGSLPNKYDKDVSAWLNINREKVLEIWSKLQSGSGFSELTASLSGDI